MRPEDAAAFTAGCMNGEPAPCAVACPFMLDVRSLLGKTEKARWNAAYKTLRNAVVFPSVVSALCPAPCENVCNRLQTGNEPVSVGQIERACVNYAKNKKPDFYVIPPKTERIAVVGAGLAGLSAALLLAQKKYLVTVFDNNDGWGGSLRTHPLFNEFDADFALQFSTVEAEFLFSAGVGSLEKLSDFDLVYIATGKDGDDFGLLSGWEPELLTTAMPGVFLGGALAGADLAGAITQGKSLSKTAEFYLQTGRVPDIPGENRGGGACRVDCSDITPSARIAPSDSGAYTEDEAMAESARCMLCDCDKCLASCEMLGTFRKKPKKIALEVYTDTKVNPPTSTHTITRQAYSCNMCGHCKAICPEDVDIGALLQTSRAARAGDKEYPAAIHDHWLREMDFATGEASFFSPGENDSDYVFFPGCQLGAHEPEYVYRSYEFLRENYGAAVFLGCCGAPAYWAGDNPRASNNFESIVKVWENLGKPVFVFACSTCESFFEQFLPELERISLYELLGRSDRIKPVQVFETASVFHPCSARSNPEMELAVRSLALSPGTVLFDLPEKNRCCGYGGHMRLANPKLYDTITVNRAGMGQYPYLVYCVNCLEVFMSRGKPCAHILDAVFDLKRSPGIPKIGEKRENALKVKRELMLMQTGKDFLPESHQWDSLELSINDDVAKSIDDKLIALSDIREAVWTSESTGEKFIDDASGVCQCCMVKPVLTYWVQYKKTGDNRYHIYGAYYHRMRIGGGEA